MENFRRENNGYSTRDVDNFLQKMRREYSEKIRRQNEKMLTMTQEMNDLKYSLEIYKEKEKRVSKALIKAVQKADEITNSSRTVYDLEIKRVQLLYRKWENVLEELRSKFAGLLPGEELENVVGDFQYALTVTLNSTLNEKGERVYSKSVLERMQHKSPANGSKFDPAISLKENEVKVYYDSEGNRLEAITRQRENNSEVTLAQKFLDGEDVQMPESYGSVTPYDLNALNNPAMNFAETLRAEKGVDIDSVLNPQDSLKEILKAFNIEYDELEEPDRFTSADKIKA